MWTFITSNTLPQKRQVFDSGVSLLWTFLLSDEARGLSLRKCKLRCFTKSDLVLNFDLQTENEDTMKNTEEELKYINLI